MATPYVTTQTVNGKSVQVTVTPTPGATVPAGATPLPPTTLGAQGVSTITASGTRTATAEADTITILPGAPDGMSPMAQVGAVAGLAVLAVMGAVFGTRAVDQVRRARAEANAEYE